VPVERLGSASVPRHLHTPRRPASVRRQSKNTGTCIHLPGLAGSADAATAGTAGYMFLSRFVFLMISIR